MVRRGLSDRNGFCATTPMSRRALRNSGPRRASQSPSNCSTMPCGLQFGREALGAVLPTGQGLPGLPTGLGHVGAQADGPVLEAPAEAVAGVAAVVAVVLLVPLPTALQLRDWATAVGPWFPLAFLAAHVVVTVLPFPRTAFTLAAGLLFGPVLGVAIAVTASTVSALLALLLVRGLGWQLSKLVSHPALDAVDPRKILSIDVHGPLLVADEPVADGGGRP